MEFRNISLDLLKNILAVLVVLIHCSFLSDYNHLFSYLIIQGISRVAVPVFFIINGYFFFEVIERDTYKLWFKKILVLYLFWMLIYSPFWFNFNLKNIFVKLLIGYHHLWYLIATLLSAFFLLIYVKKIRNNRRLFFVSISLFSIGTSLQYIGSSHFFENYDVIDKLLNISFIYRNFLFVGIPFFSIGYLMRLKRDEIEIKKLNRILIISIILLLLETILNYVFFNEENDLLFSLLLCSPVIFWFFLKFEINSNVNSKKNSLYSTSLYLIYPLVMVVIYKQVQLNSILLVVFTLLISFIISFFLIILHKKLKFIL